jgi:hypothetical protein
LRTHGRFPYNPKVFRFNRNLSQVVAGWSYSKFIFEGSARRVE